MYRMPLPILSRAHILMAEAARHGADAQQHIRLTLQIALVMFCRGQPWLVVLGTVYVYIVSIRGRYLRRDSDQPSRFPTVASLGSDICTPHSYYIS